jgi:hypothetical protein
LAIELILNVCPKKLTIVVKLLNLNAIHTYLKFLVGVELVCKKLQSPLLSSYWDRTAGERTPKKSDVKGLVIVHFR